ncbi:class I SAM-dependent methyltransferase [Catenuloplanes sp. NPDC051500]|uniref:class I SAM-dependent methyltransferase n=1 Tax=Catenuloplanes sp. NPDC051500 TaxID=3363959 RepID=UPI0037A9330F
MASTKDFDFDRLAAAYDQVLPLTAPVTARMLELTTGIAAGTSVLDIACGTGEPGLTIAASHPGVRLRGVDRAETMISVARRKAEQRGLEAGYEVMDSEALAVADDDADVVVSRFGLLSFGDSAAEAREVARVLRPGGTFTIATWDATSKNTLTFVMASAVHDLLPPPLHAAMRRQEQLAMPGRREAWLTAAGLSGVTSELFAWDVEFPDGDSLWELATGPAMLGAVLGGLGEEQLASARVEFDRLLADYRRADGSYSLPYACRIISGSGRL